MAEIDAALFQAAICIKTASDEALHGKNDAEVIHALLVGSMTRLTSLAGHLDFLERHFTRQENE